MKCNEVLQHLNEYIENDLAENLMDEISNHIEECSECRKVYEEEKRLNDMFHEALNSEPIEFNSRIGNIMNMIDKDKYSLQKEENQVNKPDEDSKVIKLEEVNKKKEKKFIFNKRIIAVAATFTIMIFMAPFIIGEQKKDMQFAVESNESTVEQQAYQSNKEDKAANKKNNSTQSIASVQNEKVEEEKQEIADAELNQDAAVVQACDDNAYYNEEDNKGESKAKSKEKVSAPENSNMATRVSFAADYKSEYLEKEHKIIFSNEESKTTIKINNEEEDLGIIDGTITSFVEENEYIYIACVGMDVEKESTISKIIKVNIKTNKIDIIYTSLKKESVIKLELEEEKKDFITITVDGQEKQQYIKR